MKPIVFDKGHGTENDFIVLPDENAELDINVELVRALCDRRAGIGADGVLRVARAGALVNSKVLDGLPSGVDSQDWFMDYRNADGSIAEMCGNGVRVFAHWLIAHDKVAQNSFVVGTRAGARPVTVNSFDAFDAEVSVEMGIPNVLGVSTCQVGSFRFAGLGVDMGNPHLACVVPGLDASTLAGLPVEQAFEFDGEFFPEGVNVEILTELESTNGEPGQDPYVHMRVHERGSGETRSCGTGTVAAAQAALADAGLSEGTVRVIVPGGELKVRIATTGSTLTGPSRIVASGSFNYLG